MASDPPLALVTGASTGIGLELARCCAQDGYDLVIVADEAQIEQAATELARVGGSVEAVMADLSTADGVKAVIETIGERPIELLLANAGHGLGHAFLDQSFDDIAHVIDTNITGTLLLVHRVAQGMRARNEGKVLFTGSIAGFMPGSFQAVYNASKAFIDSFAWALGNELKDTRITVTCLMPGPTDTEFFERADMLDTQVGADPDKADPAKVARSGYDAMMSGRPGIVAGFSNKIQAAMAHMLPASMLAEQHRKMAQPGTDDSA